MLARKDRLMTRDAWQERPAAPASAPALGAPPRPVAPGWEAGAAAPEALSGMFSLWTDAAPLRSPMASPGAGAAAPAAAEGAWDFDSPWRSLGLGGASVPGRAGGAAAGTGAARAACPACAARQAREALAEAAPPCAECGSPRRDGAESRIDAAPQALRSAGGGAATSQGSCSRCGSGAETSAARLGDVAQVSGPSGAPGGRDVAFVCDADSAMTVEASSLASDVRRVHSPDALAEQLRKLKGPIGTIYIVSHSNDAGTIYFDLDAGTASQISVGDLAQRAQNSSLCPSAISFRGCRIGQSDVGLVALRDALGAGEVSGQTCFVVSREVGPVSVAGKAIRDKSQQRDPDVRAEFDKQFKEMLDDFTVDGRNVADGIVPLKAGESYGASLERLKDVYFRNRGALVSVWSNKNHESGFFPGFSVFIKNLQDGQSPLGCQLKRIKAPNQTCTPPLPARRGGGAAGLDIPIAPVALITPAAPPTEVPTDPALIGLSMGDGLRQNLDRRPRVRQLQSRLNEHGAALEVDGMFGAATRAALQEAQTAAALSLADSVDEQLAHLLSQPGSGASASGIVGLKRNDGMTPETLGLRPNVARLQGLLSGHGAPCEADGMFGPLTQGALNQFQRANQLPEAAVVDEQTAEALEPGSGPPVCPLPEPPIEVSI